MHQAGGVLFTETLRAAGLDVGLSTALVRWRRPGEVHDPAKVLLDLAVTLALGGDCLADVAVLRAEPGVYSVVASHPNGVPDNHGAGRRHFGCPHRDRGGKGFGAARGCGGWRGCMPPTTTRRRPARWSSTSYDPRNVALREGRCGPGVQARFGFPPLCAFIDHGAVGTGEMVAAQLRPANAGSDPALDHIAVTRAALA